MNTRYNVVGRYIDGRQVVAYHLTAVDKSKSGMCTKEQLYNLIKAGCVLNCTAQMYHGKMLFRGKGIRLDNLPSKQFKCNTTQQESNKQPEVKQPEVKQPEVKQPEVKQPEVKQPEVKVEEMPKTKRVYLLFKRFAPANSLFNPITEDFRVGDRDYVTDLRLVCDDIETLKKMCYKITDRSFHTTYKYGVPRFEDNPRFVNKIYKSSDFNGWFSMIGDNDIEYIHTIEEWMKLIGNLGVKLLTVKEYTTDSGFKVSAGMMPAVKLGRHPDFEKFNIILNHYSYDYDEYYDD